MYLMKTGMWTLPVISLLRLCLFFDVSEGVDVMPNSTVEHVSFSDSQINLRLNNGDEVRNVLSPSWWRNIPTGKGRVCSLSWLAT